MEVNSWYAKEEWKQGWTVVADQSVDKQVFGKCYRQNPERWDKAFRFLSNTDLSALEPGRLELEGENLFVNVDEYLPKDEDDTRYDAHRKYADIQYLVFGREKIGVVPLEKTKVTIPYDQEKDIVFLESKESNYRIADPACFFIFFPNDAHRPCVGMAGNKNVRKIVIKVALQ